MIKPWMSAAACTITVAAAIGLASCGVVSATASAEREAQARQLVEQLASEHPEVVLDSMSSKVNRAQLQAQLPFMSSIVPKGPVPAGQTEGWRANAGTGGSTYTLVRTYDYPDRTLQVETTFAKEGETWKWQGFFLRPTMKAATAPPATPAEKTTAA